MDSKPEKPEYAQPIEVIQVPEGYIEVYNNWIGIVDGQWEPIVKNDPVILSMRQASRERAIPPL